METIKKIAETTYEQFLISDWLVSLGVDKETALDDACRIEHVISARSFEALKKLINGRL